MEEEVFELISDRKRLFEDIDVLKRCVAKMKGDNNKVSLVDDNRTDIEVLEELLGCCKRLRNETTSKSVQDFLRGNNILPEISFLTSENVWRLGRDSGTNYQAKFLDMINVVIQLLCNYSSSNVQNKIQLFDEGIAQRLLHNTLWWRHSLACEGIDDTKEKSDVNLVNSCLLIHVCLVECKINQQMLCFDHSRCFQEIAELYLSEESVGEAKQVIEWIFENLVKSDKLILDLTFSFLPKYLQCLVVLPAEVKRYISITELIYLGKKVMDKPFQQVNEDKSERLIILSIVIQILSELISSDSRFGADISDDIKANLLCLCIDFLLDGDVDKDLLNTFKFKTNLLIIISNLLFKNKVLQDLLRDYKGAIGVYSILNCSKIDKNNPFLQEWVVFAVRNMCEENIQNQELIEKLQFQKKIGNEYGIDNTLIEHGIKAKLGEFPK